MTQEQFSSLQELHRLSGLSLVKFLQREHVSYSTYNYWKRKSSSVPDHETSAPQSVLAPISLKSPCIASSSSVSGMTLLFPNGVRAHLGAGMEEAASRLINQYTCCHVLSEWYDAVFSLPRQDWYAQGYQFPLRCGTRAYGLQCQERWCIHLHRQQP